MRSCAFDIECEQKATRKREVLTLHNACRNDKQREETFVVLGFYAAYVVRRCGTTYLSHLQG